jgi:hypothetical protein
MLRIILSLIILLSISTSCFAFDTPQPPRWKWVGSDKKFGVWVDTESCTFFTESAKKHSHKNHKFAIVWTLWYHAETNNHELVREKYDFTCRKTAILSYIEYNDNGEVLNTHTVDYPSYRDIIPKTWGEAIFETVYDLYKKENSFFNW